MSTLPDSRCANDTIGTVMVDWEFDELEKVGGVFRMVKKKHRLEMQPIYCVNCGKLEGYIPRGTVSWVCFLCNLCSDTHGYNAALLPCPDKDFWDAVASEMFAAYGRALTQKELICLVDQGKLSRGLQLLERESPYQGK